MKNNVLILGDGLLGSELKRQTNWKVRSRNNGFNIENITDTLQLDTIPDIIVNCIAHTDTYEESRERHWNVNYKFVSDLVDFCNNYNIKLVHISTDYIYTNSNNNASEDDVPVHCNNWYGYTKLLGDGHVQLKCNDYILVRCQHKPRPFPYPSAWLDQVGNFDYVDTITKIIIKLINKKCSGVYNVGTNLKSMYSLATITNSVNGVLKPSNVPSNTSMNILKLNKVI